MPDCDCPLCHVARDSRKFQLLYGVPVCRKCYYAFANRRQIAFVIDSLAMLPIVFVILLPLSYAGLLVRMTPRTALMFIIVLDFVIVPLILCFKDGFNGYSPGKFLLGVQAVDARSAEPIGFAASFKRNLPTLIPFMYFHIGVALQKGPRLGDGWSHSRVIWKKYASHPIFTGRHTCEFCEYDLAGNTNGICPACGNAIPDSIRIIHS